MTLLKYCLSWLRVITRYVVVVVASQCISTAFGYYLMDLDFTRPELFQTWTLAGVLHTLRLKLLTLNMNDFADSNFISVVLKIEASSKLYKSSKLYSNKIKQNYSLFIVPIVHFATSTLRFSFLMITIIVNLYDAMCSVSEASKQLLRKLKNCPNLWYHLKTLIKWSQDENILQLRFVYCNKFNPISSQNLSQNSVKEISWKFVVGCLQLDSTLSSP